MARKNRFIYTSPERAQNTSSNCQPIIVTEVISSVTLLAFALSAAELYQQGTASFQKGNVAEAAQRFEEASRLAPTDARIWKALGASYASLGDYERANEPFTQACKLDASLEDACYYLGRNLYALNRFEPALTALNKGVRATRHPWRVHLGIAQAYEGLGDARQSEPAYRKAVTVFEALPSTARGLPDFDPRVHFSTFLYRQGRLEEALGVAQKAATDWPRYGRAHFEVGRVLYQQGKLDAAAAALENAVKNEGGAAAHLLLGQVYLRLGRAEEAQTHLTAGAKSQPAP
jgi:Flp pilus assembly protein TadD